MVTGAPQWTNIGDVLKLMEPHTEVASSIFGRQFEGYKTKLVVK